MSIELEFSWHEATELADSMCGKVKVCVRKFKAAIAISWAREKSKAFGASKAAMASWQKE